MSVQMSDGYGKLPVYDWLEGYTENIKADELVEIQFKNTRKEYYVNNKKIFLKKGDIVAVESQFGHDIGKVNLTGVLTLLQIRRKKINPGKYEFRKIYRKAKPADIVKWKEALSLEQSTMLRTRQIVKELGLDMKVGDVEYQGDKSKAIFYYIAEDRVDFRELIKILASEFRLRVEMKQIGARQEAGRIGGIGSCGRELCCSSWKSDFGSVSINAARYQELPANAQKLAGQCGKLKCCLMYELDTYMEARESIPKVLLELETTKGKAYHHKTDILKRMMYYSYSESSIENLIPIPVEQVKEIIELNKRGISVDLMKNDIRESDNTKAGNLDYVKTEDDINRFDRIVKKSSKNKMH
ncbi:MAG: hypothetical protein JW894_02415 [Bacteroidales bacterium]|nr:hypothetical protein [Bacteroidales bacterium]